MAEPLVVGSHWAVFSVKRDPAGWKASWAVYATREKALEAEMPEAQGALVSGATAVFTNPDDALARARHDAERTAAVLSGTYRD
ncbi:hypothetical protein ABIE56_000970 [Luteibacter sp. 621]|uniref:hypothetical protein n=1 Tax=Luteibacter sp. 621 TaxID=3373916 RepID=UPI003D1EA052